MLADALNSGYLLTAIIAAACVIGGIVATQAKRWLDGRQRDKDRDLLIDGVPANPILGQDAVPPLSRRLTEIERGQRRIEGWVKQLAEHQGVTLTDRR